MNLQLLSFGPQGWADELLHGLAVTAAVSGAAFVLALLFGALGAAAKLSGSLSLRVLGQGYTTVFRGVPELLVLYLVFFGGDMLLGAVAQTVFGVGAGFKTPVFVVGVLAIGICAGAYCAEVMRGAALAVPRGAIEAADSLGLTRWQRLRLVVAPIALRIALPGLGNILQITIKESALISVVGLAELLRQAAVAAGSTRQPFTFYIAAAFLFYALTLLVQVGTRRIERSTRWA
jgi:octopine/nopaline transport system permease protein